MQLIDWKLPSDVRVIPEDIKAGFAELSKTMHGVQLLPDLLCAQKDLPSGTKYIVICRRKFTDIPAHDAVVKVVALKAKDGKFRIFSSEEIVVDDLA
ncbi:MAG: hypothetical protein LBS86_00380 [Treponema sp.]|jgi:hypothetical protein|nr:hypothetical protein [Treponema sp.]